MRFSATFWSSNRTLALLGAGLVCLGRGGVRPWTAPFLVALALLAALPTVLRQRHRLGPLQHVLLAAAVWQTALLVPLPDALAGVLSPSYADLRRFVWQALPDPPTSGPLATNPAVAALDAARLWATLLLTCVLRSRWLLVPLIGLVQLVSPWPELTFVNPNHQAAFWNVGWMAAVCAAFLARRSWQRAALGLTAVALLTGVFSTLSRAGIAAGALGGALLVWRARHTLGRRRAVVAFFVVLGAIISLAVVGDRATQELRLHAEEKTRVWAQAAALSLRYPVGAGRGGFATAFAGVREVDRERGRWDYVENEYIQTLVDYGPVAGGLGLLALGWALTRRRENLHRIERATLTAIAGCLAAHALFDFNWELAGVFVPVCLLFGGQRGRGVPLRAVYIAVVLCAPALVVYGLRHEPVRLEKARALTALVRTRPLDSWPLVMLGEDAMRAARFDQALLWLNRAVAVDHDWKQPHVSLARLFCATDHKAQGRTELKLAEDRIGDDGRDPTALALLLRCSDAPGDELDIAPDFRPSTLVALIAELERAQRQESLAAIAERYLEEAEPKDTHVLAALSRWARPRHELWQRLLEAWPAGDDRAAEVAELDWQEGRHAHALVAFAELTQRRPFDVDLGSRYVALAIAAGELDRAGEANEALQRACAKSDAACRAYQLNRARLALRRGKPQDALVQYRLWLSRSPGDAEAALEAATVAAANDDRSAAIEILTALLRVRDEPSVRHRLEGLRREP